MGAAITAIIPLGLWPMPGNAEQPAELFEVAGRSLLCHAVAEVVGAGMSRAILAASDTWFEPQSLRVVLRDIARCLAGEGMKMPEVETLLIGGAGMADDLVLQGLRHARTPWSAVIAPLCALPGGNGLSELRRRVSVAGQPAVMLAPADWEMAIQLCLPILRGGRLAGVAYHRDPDPEHLAFAGRALLPSGFRFDTTDAADAGAHDFERLIAALSAQYPDTIPVLSDRAMTDARYSLPVFPRLESGRSAAGLQERDHDRTFFVSVGGQTYVGDAIADPAAGSFGQAFRPT